MAHHLDFHFDHHLQRLRRLLVQLLLVYLFLFLAHLRPIQSLNRNHYIIYETKSLCHNKDGALRPRGEQWKRRGGQLCVVTADEDGNISECNHDVVKGSMNLTCSTLHVKLYRYSHEMLDNAFNEITRKLDVKDTIQVSTIFLNFVIVCIIRNRLD